MQQTLIQSKRQGHVQSQQKHLNNNLQRAVLTLSVDLEETMADYKQCIRQHSFIKTQRIP